MSTQTPAASRRTVLRVAISGVVGGTLSSLLNSGRAAEPLTVTPVTDRLTTLTGRGGNVLVCETNDGLVVVDSGSAEDTEYLLEALSDLWPGQSVRTVFNSHWHSEQVGGNAALGQAGARIVAHEKTRLRLSTDYYLPVEDRYEPAQPPAARPTVAFYDRGEMTAGGEQIDYGYLLEAHTDGDIYVAFRDSNVIAVGDAVSPVRDPEIDWFGGGWIGGRVDALALLLELSDEQTRFVPGTGPVVGRDHVQAEHALMSVLFDRMVELIRKGMSPEEIVSDGIMDGLDRSFENPLRFVRDAHRSLWAHHNTLSHDIV